MIRRLVTLLCLIIVMAIWLLSQNSAAAVQLPPVMPRLETGSNSAQYLELVGQLGGTSNAVAVIGHYAYVGIGSRLVILDIADPSHPTLAGETASLPGIVRGVVVEGNYAYLAAGTAGLRVINVMDPAAPFEVGAYNTTDYAWAVAVVGDYAYVGAVSAGLRIIDVTAPDAPVEVGNSPGYALDVVVAGAYAYVAAGSDGLQIINVVDPAHPIAVGAYDTMVSRAVDVSGIYAYVADEYMGLLIINVANPTTPYEVGIKPGQIYQVTVLGTYVYVSYGLSGFGVVDVSNPAMPIAVGYHDTPGEVDEISAVGNCAYLADNYGGLRVVSMTDPTAPIEVGAYMKMGNAYNITVAGNFAYIADYYAGLRVINVLDPATPTEVGTSHTPWGAQGVAVSEGYAYIVAGDSGLHVINVIDPAEPIEVGTIDTPGYALDVAVAGIYAYVADGSSGVRIINVADPASPVEVGAYTGPSFAHAVVARENLVYLASGDGLQVIDVSDPTAPIEVGTNDTLGNALGVAVAGNFAYVVVNYGGLQVLDVANPAQPVVVGTCATPGGTYGLAVAGNYAYVADGGGGLRVINTEDPTTPVEVNAYNTPAWSWNVAVVERYAYVATQAGGLVILHFVGGGYNVPPNAAVIGGPMTGVVNTAYTFTAVVNPPTTTVPITYVWEATGQAPLTITSNLTSTVTFNWNSVGEKVITVTAENVGGVISDTHVLLIDEPYHIYLPLVLRTIDPVSATRQLYFSAGDVLYRMNPDGTDVTSVAQGVAGSSHLAVDQVHHKIYLSHWDMPAQILRYDVPSSGNVEAVSNGPDYGGQGLAVDPSNSRLYLGLYYNGVYAKTLNSSGSWTQLVNSTALYPMLGQRGQLQIDPSQHQIYFRTAFNGDCGECRYIWRVNFDGTQLVQLIGANGGDALALDLTNHQMYFSDVPGDYTIKRANLDGSQVETLLTIPAPYRYCRAIVLDITQQKMYLSLYEVAGGFTRRAIARANLDGTGFEVLHAITGNTASEVDGGLALYASTVQR